MHAKIAPKALFIVDGSYLLYRSFYAMKPLYTSDGTPTQAVYGFCRAIKKFIDEFNPENLIIAWDAKGKKFRTEIYAEYKATRQAPPNELFVQKNDIVEFLETIGVCQVSQEGYEADDLIYSLVKDHSHQEIVIVCPDKDLFQLLGKQVLVYDPFKDRVVDEELYDKEHGFPVSKIHFYYSLLGDASDNIPGVDGIGEKTAKDLVTKFDSLEDLYKNLDNVEKDRTRKLLDANKENAFLSYKLFELAYHKTNVKKDDYAFDKSHWNKAVDFFKRMEFKSLYKDIANKTPMQMSITDIQQPAHGKEKKLSYDWECVIIRTEEQFEDLITKIEKHKYFALDTETMGANSLQDDIVGFSVAIDDQTAYYIPLIHAIQEGELQLNRDEALNRIKPILENPKFEKSLHNAKFDALVFSQCDIWLDGIIFDTLLAANLVKLEWQKNNLKSLSEHYLGQPMQRFKEVLGTKYKNFSQVPIDEGARYAAHDALQTVKLKPILEKKLNEDHKLKKIFYDIEMPTCLVLTKMEKHGIKLDVDALKELDKDVVKEIKHIEKKIFAALESLDVKNIEELNLNSPRQIEHILFDQLKLPTVKKSSTGKRSTDHEVLQELSAQHPVPAMMLQYRELSKLKNTYIDPLPTYINTKTGNIHTSYSQTLVATGRLSSQEPNLQNIPTGEGFGLRIRDAFVARRGYRFMSADYSQIELRVLAHMTKDKNLTEAFLHDKDIHAQTAAQLFDVPLNKVTHDQRQLGKRINFSIIYGLTPYGLSKDLGITPAQAKDYIEKYFQQYPKVAGWMEHTVNEAIKNGYTQTWWGRRRYIADLAEKNKNMFEAGKRVAINSPVQGTSAEIMKLAMINVDNIFAKKGLDAALVLQIHDELIIEFHADIEDEVTKIVHKEMETVVDWEIPFKVTIRTGKTWGDVTK
ncbi:MAG: polymerase I protein [candidate division TM6 bacterium GW2011_GWF2_37_49]|nr:MAG: polymerase I protein [candidate division TM6 bacterium GW2011_GWF2_37_49]